MDDKLGGLTVVSPWTAIFRLRKFWMAYVVRGLIVWGALRIAATAAAESSISLVGKFALLGVVALVVCLEAWRRQETRFLANLGIHITAPAVPALILPAILEVMLP